MSAIEYLDRPPSGWFTLDVMRRERRKWDWVALVADFDPDDPNSPPPTSHDAWVRIPGKHRNRDAAYDALENMIATRH